MVIDKQIRLPEWVDEIVEEGLRACVIRALSMRRDALRNGAAAKAAARRLLAAADAALDRLADGRLTDEMWRKATVAIIGYEDANEVARTGRRRSSRHH
jgi:hypothetical protein